MQISHVVHFGWGSWKSSPVREGLLVKTKRTTRTSVFSKDYMLRDELGFNTYSHLIFIFFLFWNNFSWSTILLNTAPLCCQSRWTFCHIQLIYCSDVEYLCKASSMEWRLKAPLWQIHCDCACLIWNTAQHQKQNLYWKHTSGLPCLKTSRSCQPPIHCFVGKPQIKDLI